MPRLGTSAGSTVRRSLGWGWECAAHVVEGRVLTTSGWQKERGRYLAAATLFLHDLILLFSNLFAGTLSRQGFFYAALRPRLQVEGVTLYLFDYVLGLNLALKPTQGILDGLTLLQSNLCQSIHPQTSPDRTTYSLHRLRKHFANWVSGDGRFILSTRHRLLHLRYRPCRHLRLPLRRLLRQADLERGYRRGLRIESGPR